MLFSKECDKIFIQILFNKVKSIWLKKKDGKKKDALKIVYIGDDDSYWSTIQSRVVQKLTSKEIEFTKHKLKDFQNYQHLFIDVLEHNPHIVYLDFSTHLTEA